MNFFRKFFVWILLVVVVLFWGYQKFVILAPCKSPIYYHLGEFDERFKISKSDFLELVEEASLLWENSTNKDLFSASSKGRLAINLIYDERQAISDQTRILVEHVDTQKQGADDIRKGFEALQDRYDQAKSQYEILLSQFKSKQNVYNAEVSSWNKKGGAPREKYEELNDEKRALASMQVSLEEKRQEVNALADEINNLVKKYNFLVTSLNSTIGNINQHAGREFEEGEYVYDKDGERINIYEFGNRDVLLRVLAHELGHALGLDHNDNPDSIMYYLNTSKNLSLTVEDLDGLKIACRIE